MSLLQSEKLTSQPVGWVERSEPHRLAAAITGHHFQFAPPLDLQMDQSAFPAASRLRRETADYAGACHPPAPKFAALIFHVLLELP